MATKVDLGKGSRSETAPPATRESTRHPLQALREQMDRLFDDIASDWRLPSLGRSVWDIGPLQTSLWGRGAVDVRFDVAESDDTVEVSAELPGIDEKNVEVTLADGVLIVKGEKQAEKETKEKDYYLSERHYGSFVRSLRLPDSIDENKIKASFDKGVLKITAPKRAEAKAKKRKISIGRG